MKAAPAAFVTLLVLGLAGGFGVGLGWRGQEVANAQSAEHSAEMERDRYKDAANGADPAELQKAIDDLKGQVAALEQKVLDPDQTARLQKILSTSSGSVGISYAPITGQPYAKSLMDIFTKSGWDSTISQNTFGNASGDPAVIIDADKPATAQTIMAALKAADLPYVLHPDQGINKVQEIWLEPLITKPPAGN